MSSSHEGTEIPPSSGTLESEISEKDNPSITIEETGNQKLDEKVVQIEVNAENSVRGEADNKQDNSVEQSGDVSIGDIASEPKIDVEKKSGLVAELKEGSFGQKTLSRRAFEHREKELRNVVFPSEISSTAKRMPCWTTVVPVEMSREEFFKSLNSKEMGKSFRSVLDTWKDESEEYDQIYCTSSGYSFYTRSVPDHPCSGLETIARASITSPAVERVPVPRGFEKYRPPSESSSESEDGTASGSGQTSSSEDEENTSNSISQEQESLLFGRNENVKVVKVSASDFTAERLEPLIVVLSDKFRISFDISRFSKESVSCRVVGNKVDVYAIEARQNDYGYEMHEIHQIFKIPLHVDKDNFTASMKNGLLFIQAPLEIGR